MRAYELIASRAQKLGISNAELGRRIHMSPELVRRCFIGARKITADEFISFCEVLGLNISDFWGGGSH